jgi:hypothetical protein
MFITFQDLQGMASWGVALVLLLVVVGFFPVAVLIGVAVILALTAWRAAQ